MRIFLNDGLDRYQILSGDQTRRFYDLATARAFLQPLAEEPGNLQAIREALYGERAPTVTLGDVELVEELASRLVHEGLHVVSCASPYPATLTDEVAPASETAEPTPLEDEQAAQKPAEEPEEEHWIEIELVDDDGEPVPNERYLIELPDGSTVTGSLDKEGKARIEGIDPGTAKVSFPDMDKDVYEPE